MSKTVIDGFRRQAFMLGIKVLDCPYAFTWEEIADLREALDRAIRRRVDVDTLKMEVGLETTDR